MFIYLFIYSGWGAISPQSGRLTYPNGDGDYTSNDVTELHAVIKSFPTIAGIPTARTVRKWDTGRLIIKTQRIAQEAIVILRAKENEGTPIQENSGRFTS
jgi:hypothetical protein